MRHHHLQELELCGSWVIQSLWKFYFAKWTLQNKVLHLVLHLVLHSKQEANKQICASPMDKQIKYMYSPKEEFAATDHCLFDLPLDQCLSAILCTKDKLCIIGSTAPPTNKERKPGTNDKKYYSREQWRLLRSKTIEKVPTKARDPSIMNRNPTLGVNPL